MALYNGFYRYTYQFDSGLDFLSSLEARTSSGSGNNLLHPDWGVAHGHFVRVTANSYPDGIGTLWDLPVQRTGQPQNQPFNVGDMPQPRAITDAIMAQAPTEDIPSGARLNEYFQFFGQFLTHDMAEAGLTGTEPPLFLDGLPFPFARSPFVLEGGVRQQENDESSYLDLSSVYGSSAAIENFVRAGGGSSAKLLVGANGMMPTYQEVADDHGTTAAAVIAVLDPLGFGVDPNDFAAGDNRANQQTALLTHQTVWMRNHNWFVDQLRAAHPSWSEDRLFEAARALNEAEWQSVVYNEYLPKLIGANALSRYSGYKANVDASVINEWTTVAFRFGHDQTSNDLGTMSEAGAILARLTLGEAFTLGADGIRNEGGLGDWLRGQLARVTQEIDGKVVDGNRNVLFNIPGATVDLEVLDIQRGRDHGVGDYNTLRDGLGLGTYDTFEAFAQANRIGAGTLAALKSVYGDDIDKLDSIVGGLLEKNARGSQLGETFTILNVMQFEASRDGDRMFYLNRLKESPDLIRMVEATSMAEILARTSEVDHLYRDAFLAHQRIGGTDAGNRLNGSRSADLVIGFEGNDRMLGVGGNDDLYGDGGRDTAFGGLGDDMVFGGAAADTLNGDLGRDYVDGGDDDDVVWGGLGDDFVFGGKGNDRVNGGLGNDYADGGAGNDTLWGVLGRDTFAFGADSGRDTIIGFGRDDKLDMSQLGFDSFAEVQAATSRVGLNTVVTFDDDSSVTLALVLWPLRASNVLLDEPYLV
jgi:hypothetical protein